MHSRAAKMSGRHVQPLREAPESLDIAGGSAPDRMSARGRTLPLHLGPANGRNRRNLPFAQASLNDRLLHAYLPLVRGGSDSGVACAIVVMKGKATRMLRKGRRAGQ
jgi:hypothetical protein